MKIFKYLCLLCLVGLLVLPDVYAGDFTRHSSLDIKRTRNDDQSDRDSLRITSQSGASVYFRVKKDGSFYLYDSDGATVYARPANNVVYIDSYADLSTWDSPLAAIGTEAGQSYFQTEAGKTYVVDPHAIYLSGNFDVAVFSAVSAIMPLAAATNNHLDATIMIASTGATGYILAEAGVTAVQIWPSPLAGATRFGEPSVGQQNMIYHADSSATAYAVGSSTNTYDQYLDVLGESVTYRMYNNSAVSAQIVDQNYGINYSH